MKRSLEWPARVGAILCLVLSIGAAGAAAQSSADAGLSSYLSGFNDVYAKGRLDQWLERWASGAERILPTNRQKGKAEIKAAYHELYSYYEEMRLIESSRKVEENRATLEARFRAMYKPTGLRVEFPVTIRIELDSAGKLKRVLIDYDVDAVMEQLRVRTA